MLAFLTPETVHLAFLVLSAVIGFVAKKYFNSAKNEKVVNSLVAAADVVVAATEATTVSAIKSVTADGKLTKEEGVFVRDAAIDKLINIVGIEAKKLGREALADFIESANRKTK